MLVGLRFRLVFRTMSKSPGRLVLGILVIVVFLAWSFMLGLATWRLFDRNPELHETTLHLGALLIFMVQVVLGVVSLAVAEFYDVSRVMHLPVGYREVFGAMAVSGLFVPMALVYAAPGVGAAVALGGGPGAVVWRVLCVGLLLVMGHATALLLNLAFLSVMSKRRLRDLATIAASLVGVGFYMITQRFRSTDWSVLVLQDPGRNFRWLPPGHVAELFLSGAPTTKGLVHAGVALGFLGSVLWLGARALRAAFLGHLPAPIVRNIDNVTGESTSWLPKDISVMVRTLRKAWWREPQVKALYLQQTVFLLFPVVFFNMRRPYGSAEPDVGIIGFLAFMLALSHMVFFQSLFGLDGRGVSHLFLLPVSRRRILLARGIALGGFFIIADLVLAAVVLLILGTIAGSVTSCLWMYPATALIVVILDVVMLSLGTITSVFWPLRIATQGRRALSGQRSENAGCAAQIIRMLVFLPAALVGGLLSLLALLPWIIPGVPKFLAFATVPSSLLLAGGIYWGVVSAMGEQLQRREERLIRALSDSGE